MPDLTCFPGRPHLQRHSGACLAGDEAVTGASFLPRLHGSPTIRGS